MITAHSAFLGTYQISLIKMSQPSLPAPIVNLPRPQPSNHSTRAQHDKGSLETLEYLQLTFPIGFHYSNDFRPMVLSLSEDFETLQNDVQRWYGLRIPPRPEVYWVNATGWGDFMFLDRWNIQAGLRLAKERAALNPKIVVRL